MRDRPFKLQRPSCAYAVCLSLEPLDVFESMEQLACAWFLTWCLAREILSQLPAGMATELVYLMYKTVIDSTPFFEGLPRDVQTKLCLSMKPYPALAGDLVRSRHADRHITIAAHTSGVARR